MAVYQASTANGAAAEAILFQTGSIKSKDRVPVSRFGGSATFTEPEHRMDIIHGVS